MGMGKTPLSWPLSAGQLGGREFFSSKSYFEAVHDASTARTRGSRTGKI